MLSYQQNDELVSLTFVFLDFAKNTPKTAHQIWRFQKKAISLHQV